jgi:N-methylhydantoinase A
MNTFPINLGVDIGGTFTDIVLEFGTVQHSVKLLTTHTAPDDAILAGIREVCAIACIEPKAISRIIHGTTLATNALIERRGAATALITTSGFRDVLEMRTESRFEQYDLNLKLPKPLLARNHRYVLEERIAANGQVLVPLQLNSINKLVDLVERGGYESVAVGFLHSYVNDAHELMVRDVIAERLPQVMVSLSCEVSPQIREYERFNTVAVNAYVKPLIKSYLARLQTRLLSEGVHCPVFLMHSGGGIISLQSASEFPVRLIESGPAGGAIFAAHIAAQHRLEKVLSFDMGGTTAKICLINKHSPKTARVFEVARTYRFRKGSGMPISIPVIDMVEIGAGGGSLIHVDTMQQIRVGPASAGSEPGPACYQRGGEHPAVTDADLIMGRLDPDNFAGGSIVLSSSAARAALTHHLGDKLGLDATDAAYGVSEVVDENMANAARMHAIESGEDLTNFTMIAFGGAAPLHAGRLCDKLGIKHLLIPKGAGVGSAIGFLRAPFSFEATRSTCMRLSAFGAPTIMSLLSDLQSEAIGFVRSCDSEALITSRCKLYMRYVGQGWEIPIELAPEQSAKPDATVFRKLFESHYATLFGRIIQSMDVEVTVWSVTASTEPPSATPIDAAPENDAEAPACHRSLFDTVTATWVDAQVVERKILQPGQKLNGPAIVTESETSIILPACFSATILSDGCISINKDIVETA